MGTIVFAVMQCLGEMVSHLPVSGGHITLARRFVGEDMVRLSSIIGPDMADDQSRLSPLAGNIGIVSEKVRTSAKSADSSTRLDNSSA